MLDLDNPPTFEELENAMSKMKRRKVGGKTGILPELLMYGGSELMDRLLLLIEDIWREGAVVKDWKDAVIVPIPKKGDLKSCDNWRGISLLEDTGKVFGRILNGRLQMIAEKILPESQCGFRVGRGCVDMIFVARQLMEKTRKHDDSLFTLFMDLRKAYDSMPRSALWSVLEKSGVPPTMLSVIRSLHEGMTAVVRVGDGYTNSLSVENGLRQGCTIAPTLFNLYFSAMVASWRAQCPRSGVTVKYKIGRKLVGDRTAKTRLKEVVVTESQFADDVAAYATTRGGLKEMTSTCVKTTADWGLTVSLQKTKAIAAGRNAETINSAPIQLSNGVVEVVDEFTYLGSNITKDGEIGSEVSIRVSKASRAFGCLKKCIFRN